MSYVKFWDIKVYGSDDKGKWKVVIQSLYSVNKTKVTGYGSTPHKAYDMAMSQLTIKPWLNSEETNPAASDETRDNPT